MSADHNDDPAMRMVRLHTFEMETLALAIERLEAEARCSGDHESGDLHACRAAELMRLARPGPRRNVQ